MKQVASIVTMLMLLAVGAQAQLVWPTQKEGIIFKKFGPRIETVKPPEGFTVTPAEVSEMFSPRKFLIMIYASDTHYFVTRYDRNQTWKKAQLFGVKINGKTGAVDGKSLGLTVLKTYEEITKERTSNKAPEATSEPAPSAASSSPQG
jgi:hypothetical protein